MYAEKKAKPGQQQLRERSKIKRLKNAEMTDVLQDTRESEKTFMALLRSLGFVFTEVIRTFQFRLSTM